MCRAFSCIITKDERVLWEVGVDSHDELISGAGLKDDTTDGDLIKFAKIEITPDKGYLHPEGNWTLSVDENTTPRWLTKKKIGLCWDAFGEWKERVYSNINLTEARNPINPLLLEPQEVTEQDIELLKQWDSVRDSVGDSVWASVGDSVGASVGASVWAYIGSLFLNIKDWIYAPKTDGYPYQSCVDLWKRGFVPSYDGKTWRLHSGKDAKIVYQTEVK